jgi:membrane associated rhomboid family serine protease
VIPLRDKNPTRRVPVVNIALIVVNIAVFVYELGLGGKLPQFFQTWGVVPGDVSGAFASGRVSLGGVLPLFSTMFIHGGWLHLGGNMLYLWIFGDNVEDKLGHGRYLVFYLVCGLTASVLSIVVDPHSTMPIIGASGAIAGVLGAYLLMFPRARVLTLIPFFFFLPLAELPALIVLGFWFVMQFFSGLISLGFEAGGMGGVAWWSHIGGFAAGLVLTLPLRKYQ